MRLSELEGKRVGIWGAGREGAAVRDAIRELGSDASADVFTDADGPVRDRIFACDVLVKSPGVSLYRPEVQEALKSGIRVTSATNLALAEVPAEKIVAVTGTKGKSTTASLIAHLLRSTGARVVLAGNIGVPILQTLRASELPDFYVIELSSYQIADLEYFPRYAVLTNLYRDHLTWHGDVERYRSDKFRLFSQAEQIAFFNAGDEVTKLYAPRFPGKIRWYNTGETLPFPVSAVRLPGEHNLANVFAALTILAELGFDRSRFADAISDFKGLPHRLSVLGEQNGATYVDDSISTVPETALAALSCFPGRPVTLILGGLDRGQDWPAFAQRLAGSPPRAVLTLPDNGPQIARSLREGGVAAEIHECGDLSEAVACAASLTPSGGVVLLSPASASFTQFANFEERGRAFAKLAGFT